STLDHDRQLLGQIPKNKNSPEPRPGLEKPQGRGGYRCPGQGPRLRRAERETDNSRLQILSKSTCQGREGGRTMHTLLPARRGESSRNKRYTSSIEELVRVETDKSVRVDRLIENFFSPHP